MCVGITSHSARAKGATQEAHLFLIAAFCRRDQSLSHWRETRFLERAMGIEPTSEYWENFRYKFGTIQERRNKRSARLGVLLHTFPKCCTTRCTFSLIFWPFDA